MVGQCGVRFGVGLGWVGFDWDGMGWEGRGGGRRFRSTLLRSWWGKRQHHIDIDMHSTTADLIIRTPQTNSVSFNDRRESLTPKPPAGNDPLPPIRGRRLSKPGNSGASLPPPPPCSYLLTPIPLVDRCSPNLPAVWNPCLSSLSLPDLLPFLPR